MLSIKPSKKGSAMLELSPDQAALAAAPLDDKTLLRGPAGTGRTTVGVGRLAHLLLSGVPGDAITVMVPQRTLAAPYYALLNGDHALIPPEGFPPGSRPNIVTLGGMARRAVDLFWPLAAEAAGFARPTSRPTFLTLEAAGFFMARLVGPVIAREGLFDSVKIEPGRLYSQIIDNLNKSAVVGTFSHEQIGERLKSAWNGDREQLRMYDDVQASASLFRAFCLEHNLLDFSLQVEVFMRHLWPLEPVQTWLTRSGAAVIADNIEEDTPAAHRVLAALTTGAQTALHIYDEDAGFRAFLGADETDALRLEAVCDRTVRLDASFVSTPELGAFAAEMAHGLDFDVPLPETDPRAGLVNLRPGRPAPLIRYFTDMIADCVERIASLVQDGTPPGEIVVLAPYMTDALRFSLMNRLETLGVPVRSHRPSRSLRQEPAAQAMLTLASLAHPHWGMTPTPFDVSYALMRGIYDMDLVRARLLTRQVYRVVDGVVELRPFDALDAVLQGRITYVLGGRYEALRAWLLAYSEADDEAPLDHFFSRLFGEVLSQPGFGFQLADDVPDKDAATVAANLVESARKFRQMLESSGTLAEGESSGQVYAMMVQDGVIANQYLGAWQVQQADAVLVAPAYTFLLSNRPVDYQFWLNVGGGAWAERLFQPLTNPDVLSLAWPEGARWTDDLELAASRSDLHRLVTGLVRRCRRGIYLGYSDLGEQGYEQRGVLLQLVQRMLKRLAALPGDDQRSA